MSIPTVEPSPAVSAAREALASDDPFAVLRRYRRATNFLAAILIFTGFNLAYGVPQTPAVVGAVEPGSGAAQAGLRAGDRIVRIDGNRIYCTAMDGAVNHADNPFADPNSTTVTTGRFGKGLAFDGLAKG